LNDPSREKNWKSMKPVLEQSVSTNNASGDFAFSIGYLYEALLH
jgi:hypothetical protein